jgi:predicted acyltransferase
MTQRLRSLDVFRGATVALMILVNNPGSWAHLYPPLAHAAWHGVTPTDLVFPFFLFAVGHALALVLPRFAAGAPAAFWWKVLKRTVLIFAIGLALNISPLVRWSAEGELVWRSLEQLRVMGVLQRIALCFGAAAAIAWTLRRAGPSALLAAAAALLLGYWGACLALGAPGDPFSLEGFFGTHWDRALLGAQHLYRGEGVPFDPEGLASTVPAVAQVLLGVWVGQLLGAGDGQAPARPDATRLLQVLAWAAVLLGLALVWQAVFPFNKKIWTSSYVLLTTALAMALVVAMLYRLEPRGSAPSDARPLPAWARFFEVFGLNPLFIFVLSGFVPRVLGLLRWPDGVAADGTPKWLSPLPWAWREVFAPLARLVSDDPRLGSLLFALANLSVYWALAAWMDRRRIYIRV